MSPQTRETVERVAYAAVGAPIAVLKALGERVSEMRDSLESAGKEMNDDLAAEISEWIVEGEKVIERAMERIRATGMVDELRTAVKTTRKSAEARVRSAAGTIGESGGVVVPDTDLTRINGVGPSYAAKLSRAGVQGLADFLSVTRTKRDIARLAEATGFSSGTIEGWRDQVDFSRVDGIGVSHQRSLRRVDVWTLRELSTADPGDLIERMRAIDSSEKTPSTDQMKQWVADARSLIRDG